MRRGPSKFDEPGGRGVESRHHAEERLGWWGKIKSVLAHDAWVHCTVLAAVAVGFFHGWIKLKFRHPATTFLFDALLALALVLLFFRLPRGVAFFPKCPIVGASLAFYALAGVYALVPSEMPWVVRLAALRAWCFPSLVFVLGYHLTRKVNQVKGYFWVFALLGVATAVYGMRQSPEEIQKKALEDEYFAKRYSGVYYQTKEGKAGIRIFSTFVSAGAFGGVMAFVAGLVAASLVDPGLGKRDRRLLFLALIPLCYGLALSGARSSLVMLIVSLSLVAWYSGRAWIPLGLGMGALGAFFVFGGVTGGASGRFASLLESGTFAGRVLIPFEAAWNTFWEAPMGTGLGSSSLGVPFFLVEQLDMERLGFRRAEGDLQCVITDMGLIGLVMFLTLLVRSGQLTVSTLQHLRHTPAFPVALACATALIPTIIAMPIGSPFLGIPSGPMTWFFLGTLQKLSSGVELGSSEREVPRRGPAPSGRKFFYYRPDRDKRS